MKGEKKIIKAIGLLLSCLALMGCSIHEAPKGKSLRNRAAETIILEKAETKTVKEPKAEPVVEAREAEAETEIMKKFEALAAELETMLAEAEENKLDDIARAKLAEADKKIAAKKMLLAAEKKRLDAMEVLVEKEAATVEIEKLLKEVDFEDKKYVTNLEAFIVAQNQLADALEKAAAATAGVEEANEIFKVAEKKELELARQELEMCRSGFEAEKNMLARIEVPVPVADSVGELTYNISLKEMSAIMEAAIISGGEIVEAEEAVAQKESAVALKTLAEATRKDAAINGRFVPLMQNLDEIDNAEQEDDDEANDDGVTSK